MLERESSAEFQAKCVNVVKQWEAGRMPYVETREALGALMQDAINRGHIADQGRVEQVIGYMEVARGNLNISINHFERARAIYNQVGNSIRAAICDMNIGESYRIKVISNGRWHSIVKPTKPSKTLVILRTKLLRSAIEGRLG